MINRRDQNRAQSLFTSWCNPHGFTLVELLVGMVIGGLVSAAILGSYISLTKMARNERDKSVMQINQRGSVENLEFEVRMAGYNPQNIPNFVGVTDVRRYSVTDRLTPPVLDPNGSPSLTVIYDEFRPTPPGPNGVLDANDTFYSFRLFDENGDGSTSLVRDRATGLGAFTFPREVLADNILAVAFAYAYDENGDGNLDTAGGNIIWAIDSDNDNRLDYNLDPNNDGILDAADDTSGDRIIGGGDVGFAGNLAAPVDRIDIRSVKVWVLARAEKLTKGYHNEDIFRVGDRLLSATPGYDDWHPSLKVMLMVRTIECLNMP